MQIDDHVPIPTRKQGPARIYPWHDLEVGQSFWADTYPNNLRATAKWHELRYGLKFAVRKEGTGSRAWRVA